MSINEQKSGLDITLIDQSVKPTNDFFAHANGIWLKNNPIPADKSSWGSFYVLREESLHALHEILEELMSKEPVQGSEEQKLRDYYATGMNMEKRNQQGNEPLKKYFQLIDGIETPDDYIGIVQKLHRIGIMPFWSFGISPDEKNSSRVLPYFGQCSLGLPERDYYFRDDEKSKNLRQQYLEHIQKMFALADFSNPQEIAQRVFDVELNLAKFSMNPTELRDIIAQYNPYTEKELQKLSPDIAWSSYLRYVGLPELETCIVAQPKFFQALAVLLKELHIDAVKDYLRWHLIRAAASFLSDDFVNQNFNFYGKILNGTPEIPALWKRCIDKTDNAIGEALGKLYVEKHFSREAKQQINELVDNLTIAYERRIKNLDWMSSDTKEKAITKLKAIQRKLGYPDVWRDYGALAIGTESFFENECAASAFEFDRMIAKYGKPVDRTEWLMTPSTVNAYYWPNLNEIAFPAGIMQPPFFDPNAYAAINYGGIGSVIGHELTHGFDDQGSLYDGQGNLQDWWTSEDKEKFGIKTKLIVKQYNSYKVLDDINLNGSLTQGENIADLGGLVIAYDALQEHFNKHGRPELIDGFTPEQLFFYGYARCECDHRRPEIQRMLVLTDPHSPARFRVNGTVINMPPFHDAFKAQTGDPLYTISPLVIW